MCIYIYIYMYSLRGGKGRVLRGGLGSSAAHSSLHYYIATLLHDYTIT